MSARHLDGGIWRRRAWARRLTAAGLGRAVVFLAGGAVFYALLELGPLTTLAIMGGLLALGAAAFGAHSLLKSRRRRHHRPSMGSAMGFAAAGGPALGGLDWTSTPAIPFGAPRRRLGATLTGTPGARVSRPRYFLDPLVAGTGDAPRIPAGPATGDIFVGFTLRRRFEEALDQGEYDNAARIIAEMAETTDNQAWCVNANRRLAYRRARAYSGTAHAVHH